MSFATGLSRREALKLALAAGASAGVLGRLSSAHAAGTINFADIGVGDTDGDWSRYTKASGYNVNLVAIGNAPSEILNVLVASGGAGTYDVLNNVGGMEKPAGDQDLIEEPDTSQVLRRAKDRNIGQAPAQGRYAAERDGRRRHRDDEQVLFAQARQSDELAADSEPAPGGDRQRAKACTVRRHCRWRIRGSLRRHPECVQRLDDGGIVLQRVPDREAALHQIDVRSLDPGESGEALADRGLLGRAVHPGHNELDRLHRLSCLQRLSFGALAGGDVLSMGPENRCGAQVSSVAAQAG